MRNVVAYCRVSTDAQAGEDRFGLDAQKKMIMEYCAKNDMQISDWYIDEGESGVKDNRPQLDRLLYGEIKNPPVEAVVVAKNDRVAREIKLYFYYKQLLYAKGMELISVSEDFGELGVFSGILEAFVMFVAEQERMNITKRTSGGRAVKAAKGGYAGGRVPYGYTVKDKQLVIVPEEAEAVRKIFEMKRDGATFKQIVDVLNAAGYRNKSGGEFTISTVQFILGNERLYQGFYKYGKNSEWVKGQHEPILNDRK
mgnify:CR=1 FL=1